MTALHRDAMAAGAPSRRASAGRVEPPGRLSAGQTAGPFCLRPAASATASAVMCTPRRVVTLADRMCTEVAALSRIGPIVGRA